MIVFPIGVDVVMHRWPWMNWVIMAVTVVAFFYCWRGDDPTPFLEACVANGDSAWGHLLHPLAHMDFMHLAGNMLFLWVFGNAVCAKVGNFWYPIIYAGCGLGASLLHDDFSDSMGIGASAAINGISGIFLVWYALNTVRFTWVVGYWWSGEFDVAAYWAILAWLAFDLINLGSHDGIGHGAHIAGLFVGVALGFCLSYFRVITPEPDERSLLQLVGLQRDVEEADDANDTPSHAPMTKTTTKTTASVDRRTAPRTTWRNGPPPPLERKPVVDDPIPLADEPEKPVEKRPL
ncbi:MAG: rhomboid family intramembrane serine protease [Phycisphaerae bacterium]|nr:rhomboid family intramembrane serine protease [Phycisphaerae bacterium]